MKSKKVLWSFLTVIMLLSMTVGAVLADDGEMFRKKCIQNARSGDRTSQSKSYVFLCASSDI